MPNKRIIIIVLSIVSLVTLAIYFFSRFEAGNSTGINASGIIESEELDIATEVPGKLVEVRVNEGDKVKVGDVLAKIDSTLYDLQVKQNQALLKSSQAKASETKSGSRQELIDQARANVQQVSALLEAAKKAMINTQDNYNRMKELYISGGASEQQLDNAETQLQTAKAQYEAQGAQLDGAREQLNLLLNGATENTINMADAGVAQAQAALSIAESNLLKTILTSPIDAEVSSVNFQKGELVTSGSSVISLQDSQNLWVQVYIPETDIPRVKLNMPVKIFIDAYPNKPFPGEVTYISPKAEFTPKNIQTKEERIKTVFAVKVKVKDGFAQLKPGLPADIRINL